MSARRFCGGSNPTWPLFVTRVTADIFGTAARAVGVPAEPGTLLQHLRDHTGLRDHETIGLINFQDAVHSFQRQQHTAENR